MAAGNDQADGGEGDLRFAICDLRLQRRTLTTALYLHGDSSTRCTGRGGKSEHHAVEMGMNMIDADERFAHRPGESFGGGDADEEGSDQAGAVGDGDGVDLVESGVGLLQGFA